MEKEFNITGTCIPKQQNIHRIFDLLFSFTSLKQIENKKYETELLEKEVKDIVKLTIVFKGKEIKVTQVSK